MCGHSYLCSILVQDLIYKRCQIFSLPTALSCVIVYMFSMLPMYGSYLSSINICMTICLMYGPCKFAILCWTLIHPCTYISSVSSRQDGGQPPITTFLEFFGEMQSADPDAPLDPPNGSVMYWRHVNYFVVHIDECTWYFLRLQKSTTIALERYHGCLLVGMQIHMLGRVVPANEHIGLIVPQLEFI